MRLIALMALLTSVAACSAPPDPRRTNFRVERPGVTALYDDKTGRLKRVDADTDKDGKLDAFSYWDGAALERIEIDRDEDGTIDRWEHYGPGTTLVRVGTSSLGDGVEDTWNYADAEGRLGRIEYDTDRNGMVDKRDTYGSGPANRPVLAVVDLELDASGRPARRLFYKPDGNLDRSEAGR